MTPPSPSSTAAATRTRTAESASAPTDRSSFPLGEVRAAGPGQRGCAPPIGRGQWVGPLRVDPLSPFDDHDLIRRQQPRPVAQDLDLQTAVRMQPHDLAGDLDLYSITDARAFGLSHDTIL